MGLACTRSGEAVDISSSLPIGTVQTSLAKPSLILGTTGQPTPFLPDAKPTDTPMSMFSTPTLDPTRVSPISTTGPGSYVVQSGDTIGSIAARFGVTPESIIQLNQLSNPSALEVGQVLMIPVPESEKPGPNFKIIPDSELVYGPAANGFDPAEFLKGKQGYLQNYHEMVNDRDRTGPELILFTAEQYSVNPRILMAVLGLGMWIGSGLIKSRSAPEHLPKSVTTSP